MRPLEVWVPNCMAYGLASGIDEARTRELKQNDAHCEIVRSAFKASCIAARE